MRFINVFGCWFQFSRPLPPKLAIELEHDCFYYLMFASSSRSSSASFPLSRRDRINPKLKRRLGAVAMVTCHHSGAFLTCLIKRLLYRKLWSKIDRYAALFALCVCVCVCVSLSLSLTHTHTHAHPLTFHLFSFNKLFLKKTNKQSKQTIHTFFEWIFCLLLQRENSEDWRHQEKYSRRHTGKLTFLFRYRYIQWFSYFYRHLASENRFST